MRRVLAAVAVLVALLLLLIIFNPPIGSYTLKWACSPGPDTPVLDERLSIIKGETLSEVKSNDRKPGPTEGCSVPVKYVQYIR